ncbi:MAG: contact-dependent growth inhibition system immunity protein [Bacteroidota bacterium]
MKEEILNKSINELEGNKSNKRPDFNSYPVQKSYDLMDKKLCLFEPEDLRLMIGQKLGLKYLIPIAINILKKDPLIEANFFEGDLLLKVLNIDQNFWNGYPKLKEEVLKMFKDNLIDYDSLDDDDTKWEIYSAYESLTD